MRLTIHEDIRVPGRFSDWLDHRIGHRKLIEALLLEHIPGGARWRYVWGSTLAFVFMIQLITGILLMTSYSASDANAWGSVHYIQYKMDFGWLIRGLHHYGSQTMMVLIACHMLQVVIAGAHLPPREINWWLGLGLLGVTFGLGLTGYLLPWDQKGYWATRVATNIASYTPFIGEELQQFLVGGPEYGNHTLTRFFAFHVGLLPALFIILLILHLTAFRRHGVTYPPNSTGSGTFWPDQAFRDLLACLVVFGVMVSLVVFGGHGNPVTPAPDERPEGWYQELAKAGQKGWGANLDAPADRDTPAYPARPEWYFMFLFHLLEMFSQEQRLIPTFYIPNGVMILLFLLPFVGIGRFRKFGHFFGILVVVALLAAVATLTVLAFVEDSPEPWFTVVIDGSVQVGIGEYYIADYAVALILLLPLLAVRRLLQSLLGIVVVVALLAGAGSVFVLPYVYQSRAPILSFGMKPVLDEKGEFVMVPVKVKDEKGEVKNKLVDHPTNAKVKKAQKFEDDRKLAGALALVAAQRGMDGIPVDGARELIRNDPMTRGKDLFEKNCAVCHKFTANGDDPFGGFVAGKFSASDLGGYGSAKWVRGLLNNPGDDRFFGLTKLEGMKKWRKGIEKAREKAKKKDAAAAAKDIADEEADFDTIARFLADQAKPREKRDKKLAEDGDAAMTRQDCFSCHSMDKKKPNSAPDFTDYGSQDWIRFMVMNPGHKLRYGGKSVMPYFRNLDGPGAEVHNQEFQDATDPEAKISVIPLTNLDRELIIRWLTRDGRVVFGGRPVSGPPKRD